MTQDKFWLRNRDLGGGGGPNILDSKIDSFPKFLSRVLLLSRYSKNCHDQRALLTKNTVLFKIATFKQSFVSKHKICIFCVNISPLIQQQYSYIFRNKLQKLQRKRSNKFYNFNSKYTSYNICTKHIFISNMYVTLSQYLQLIAQPYSSFSLLFFFEFV